MAVKRRKKERDHVEGGNTVLDLAYNRQTAGIKVLTLQGQLTPMGDAAVRKPLPTQSALVALFNPAATPVYVKFGNSTVTAPAGGADGIAVPPGAYIGLAAGENTHVIASGSCFAYLIEDDTYWS